MYQCNAFSNHWYDTRSISILQTASFLRKNSHIILRPQNEITSSSLFIKTAAFHKLGHFSKIMSNWFLVVPAQLFYCKQLPVLCLIGFWVVPAQLFYCKQLPVLCLIGFWVVPAQLFYCKQLPVSYQLIVRLERRKRCTRSTQLSN